MKSKRRLSAILNVGGVLVECTTIQGLANIVGKSKDTMLRYEELGYLPMAPLKKGIVRYYPVSLCKALAPIIKGFPTNRPPKAESIVKINQLFNEERARLCQNQKNQTQE